MLNCQSYNSCANTASSRCLSEVHTPVKELSCQLCTISPAGSSEFVFVTGYATLFSWQDAEQLVEELLRPCPWDRVCVPGSCRIGTTDVPEIVLLERLPWEG